MRTPLSRWSIRSRSTRARRHCLAPDCCGRSTSRSATDAHACRTATSMAAGYVPLNSIFLIGAMTIVEVIDAHNGFEVITSQIRTKKQVTLMWIICFVTFFLSAVLDNLTTTIVIISLMKKLSGSQRDRLFFAAMIVIAANAGGAWSPIGDVTTTMLWIGGQITPLSIVKGVFLPLTGQSAASARCRKLPAQGTGNFRAA